MLSMNRRWRGTGCSGGARLEAAAMSTFTIDTSTSRATPSPVPGKRMTAPSLRGRKVDGAVEQPIVMLTAYTMRMAQLLDPHCDMLLVGDSLGQVIYGLPSTIPVTMEMMCAHGAAVVRGSWHALVAVDMPFGSYEASPEKAFESAARIMKETGCAAVKLEGGEAMAPTIELLTHRGIPVIGIGASAACDGQVLVTDDMLGMFERTPRFVKRYDDLAGRISEAARTYAEEVRSRSFPTAEQTYS